MDPVAKKVPVAGSYNSAEARGLPEESVPPATRTLPLGNKAAMWLYRVTPIDPVAEKIPVAGSYNSAEARKTKVLAPPATRTLPLESRVDVCPSRAVPIDPVADHVAAQRVDILRVDAAAHANCLDRSLFMSAPFESVLGGHHVRGQVTDW